MSPSSPLLIGQVIELAQPLSAKMQRIQVALVDALDTTLLDLKKFSKKVSTIFKRNVLR